jgi:CheY-like chemotaxis protein
MVDETPTVLVVDDDAGILQALGAALRARGLRVAVARDGKEALEVTARERPAAVILDLGLPDIDGVEVCRRLREWTNVPVIVREKDVTAVAEARIRVDVDVMVATADRSRLSQNYFVRDRRSWSRSRKNLSLEKARGSHRISRCRVGSWFTCRRSSISASRERSSRRTNVADFARLSSGSVRTRIFRRVDSSSAPLVSGSRKKIYDRTHDTSCEPGRM